METTIIIALVTSIIFFLALGFRHGHKNKSLSDMFPIYWGRNASVDNTEEFTSSSVSTTISLATIIMAYFELAGQFGLFLLWTTITTALGMLLLSKLSNRIWDRLQEFDHRPTLHYYLGHSYNSKTIAFVGALATSIGVLLIAALELIVGSSYLSQLIPSIPPIYTTVALSATGIIYLSIGGFKSVIRSDVWQMKFIWLLIIAVLGYYVYDLATNNSLATAFQNVPKSIYDFSDRPGLWMFLIGIAIMNIPTHLSNQAMFQRITASQKKDVVIQGLKKSTRGIFWSWTLIVIIACMAYIFVPDAPPENLLTSLLMYIGQTGLGKLIIFFVTIGLYSALLSTASTNLAVVGHTLSEDIFARFKMEKDLRKRDASKKEFYYSRIILLVAGIFSIFIVEFLTKVGFDIKDLVFSIYGGTLALFPPILFSLFLHKNKLNSISTFAFLGIILGFLVGWGIAFYGKFSGAPQLIFLSPTFSIATSFLVLITGCIVNIKRASRNDIL